jgi:hypothetical protein
MTDKTYIYSCTGNWIFHIELLIAGLSKIHIVEMYQRLLKNDMN